MKSIVVTAALALALSATPLLAQNSAPGAAGTGFSRDPAPAPVVPPGLNAAPGNMSDPAQRMRPEIERRRADDLQRGVPPMTTDPRLGPPSASDTGGLGRVPGRDAGAGLRR